MASSDHTIHINAEELYGHIRSTQEALVELAALVGVSNQLRSRILYIDDFVWRHGLQSTEDESSIITRDDLPYFFQGMRDANEYLVTLINARTPAPNQLGLEFSSHHGESESVDAYHHP